MEKIKSGDIFEIAAVVRNLMLRDAEKSSFNRRKKNAKQCKTNAYK